MATWADRRDAYNAEMRGVARQEAELRRVEGERNALAEILRGAYEPSQEARPAIYGPVREEYLGGAEPNGVGQEAMPARAGGFNMQNAIARMAQSRFAPEALKLMESIKPRQTEYTLGEIGAGNDQVQSVVFDKASGKYQPVGDTRRKSSTPDWMMPGYVDAQKKIAEAKGEGRMSPTVQKELFEADEGMQASSNVLGLLGKAKELNKGAMFGPYASTRAKAFSLLPGEDAKANATIDLDNIMTGQALESLKLIFGGMPTEGERKILLDMQASVDKTPAQREAILDRAMEMAQRRMTFNKSKAESLRSGKYFKEAPQISEPSIGANSYKIPQGARTGTDEQGRKVFSTDGGKSVFDATTGQRIK